MVASSEAVLLIVEGDTTIRHGLAGYLRTCGFTVLEATSGREARALLLSGKWEIKIVLADMTTPGSGFPLKQWISESGLSPRVILAGSLEKAVGQAGDLCNEGPALAKPYTHHLVLDEIKRELARRDRG